MEILRVLVFIVDKLITTERLNSVLYIMWNDDTKTNYLVAYIKPDYKVMLQNIQNVRQSSLTDEIISCYLEELVIQSKGVSSFLLDLL